jgi:hypothetical protein
LSSTSLQKRGLEDSSDDQAQSQEDLRHAHPPVNGFPAIVRHAIANIPPQKKPQKGGCNMATARPILQPASLLVLVAAGFPSEPATEQDDGDLDWAAFVHADGKCMQFGQHGHAHPSPTCEGEVANGQ